MREICGEHVEVPQLVLELRLLWVKTQVHQNPKTHKKRWDGEVAVMVMAMAMVMVMVMVIDH